MSITGVSITKATSFRGVAQEFANTYYYQTPLPVTEGTADSLIDAIVALERPMHGTNVSFIRGRAWSAGGTPAENNQLASKLLTGNGTNSASQNASMDKERAFLVRIRAGVDSRGRPVYLRKWFHLDVGTVGGVAISGGALQNTASLTAPQRSQLETWMNSFKNVTAGAQGFDLVSEKNRSITGATQAHPYLEHHQLGDMWR
jgi:hypothetical protein